MSNLLSLSATSCLSPCSPRSGYQGRQASHSRKKACQTISPTCGEFARLVYLPHIRLRKRSWPVDERILRQHILPTFATVALHELSRSDVETWLYSLVKRGLVPASCNRILSVFKSLCTLAVACGFLFHSPCTGVAPLKIRQVRERYLSRDEARRLIHALQRSSRQEAKVLHLLLLTGARKSEILKARWEHVHLEQQLLTVPLSKSNRPRHIVLSNEAVTIIRKLPRQPGCPWLFPGHTPNRPLSDIYFFWNELRHKLGLAEVRIHDLRHTFASILVNAGHSLYEVQCLLGHSDPRTTMRYAHLGRCSMLAAAGTVSTFLYGIFAKSGGHARAVVKNVSSQLLSHKMECTVRCTRRRSRH